MRKGSSESRMWSTESLFMRKARCSGCSSWALCILGNWKSFQGVNLQPCIVTWLIGLLSRWKWLLKRKWTWNWCRALYCSCINHDIVRNHSLTRPVLESHFPKWHFQDYFFLITECVYLKVIWMVPLPLCNNSWQLCMSLCTMLCARLQFTLLDESVLCWIMWHWQGTHVTSSSVDRLKYSCLDSD